MNLRASYECLLFCGLYVWGIDRLHSQRGLGGNHFLSICDFFVFHYIVYWFDLIIFHNREVKANWGGNCLCRN